LPGLYKILLTEEGELEKLLAGSALIDGVLPVSDDDDEIDEPENIMEEVEEGVDEDEIKDMGEEGEEEEMNEEEEMGLADDDQKEDY
jgi:hypothetical protein